MLPHESEMKSKKAFLAFQHTSEVQVRAIRRLAFMLMFTVDNTRENGGVIKLYQHKFENLLNKCPIRLHALFRSRRTFREEGQQKKVLFLFFPPFECAKNHFGCGKQQKQNENDSSETFPRIDSSQLKYFFHMLLMMYTYTSGGTHHHGNTFSYSTFSTFHRVGI